MEQLTEPFERTLDTHGRIVIPSTLRKHYSGELIVMKGPEQRIWLMTRNTHGEFLQTINAINDSPQDNRCTILHYLLGNSIATEMDKSGRIKLPPALISYAQLSKKCLIRSVEEQGKEPERLEIWST
jgi:MraZ protein